MKFKILIIGKKSFIAQNLHNYLRKKNFVTLKDFYDVIKKKKFFLKQFNFIINCSIDKKYINSKYNEKFDRDFIISKKIKSLNLKQIFFSTRKVYNSKMNISENDLLKPKCNYSKNKLITEKKLISNLGNRVLIFRISNLIGYTKYNLKKKHKLFIDIFFENIKQNIIFINGKSFKDFMHIDKFCEVVQKSIRKNIYGIYNLSIGKKVNLDRMISWLNKFNRKKKCIIFKKNKKNDSFYLNNKKLKSKVNFVYKISDLKKDCEKLSEQFFLKYEK